MFLGVKINCGGGEIFYQTLTPIVDSNTVAIKAFLQEITVKTGVVFFYNYNTAQKKVYFGAESDCKVKWIFTDIDPETNCFDLPQIVGCNDPLATNYNPNATINDGTCIYPPPLRKFCISVPAQYQVPDVEALLGTIATTGTVVQVISSPHCEFNSFSFDSTTPQNDVLSYYNDTLTNPNFKIKANYCNEVLDITNRCNLRDRLRPESLIMGYSFIDQNGVTQVNTFQTALNPNPYVAITDILNNSGLGYFTYRWDINTQEVNILSETTVKMYQLIIFDGSQPTYLNFNC